MERRKIVFTDWKGRDFRVESLLASYDYTTDREREQIESVLDGTPPDRHMAVLVAKTDDVKLILKYVARLVTVEKDGFSGIRFQPSILSTLLSACSDETFDDVLRFRAKYCAEKIAIFDTIKFRDDDQSRADDLFSGVLTMNQARATSVYRYTKYDWIRWIEFLLLTTDDTLSYIIHNSRAIHMKSESIATRFYQLCFKIGRVDLFRYVSDKGVPLSSLPASVYHMMRIHPRITEELYATMSHLGQELFESILPFISFADEDFPTFLKYLGRVGRDIQIDTVMRIRDTSECHINFSMSKLVIAWNIPLSDNVNRHFFENMLTQGRCVRDDCPEFVDLILEYAEKCGILFDDLDILPGDDIRETDFRRRLMCEISERDAVKCLEYMVEHRWDLGTIKYLIVEFTPRKIVNFLLKEPLDLFKVINSLCVNIIGCFITVDDEDGAADDPNDRPMTFPRTLGHYVTVVTVLRSNIRHRARKLHEQRMKRLVTEIKYAPPKIRGDNTNWFPGGIRFQAGQDRFDALLGRWQEINEKVHDANTD